MPDATGRLEWEESPIPGETDSGWAWTKYEDRDEYELNAPMYGIHVRAPSLDELKQKIREIEQMRAQIIQERIRKKYGDIFPKLDHKEIPQHVMMPSPDEMKRAWEQNSQ